MPWRNGLGTTLEIARAPAAPAQFQWRLSLATVAHSAPFSSYPGYRRSVSLIEGAGFQLDVEGQAAARLRAVGDSIQFPGDAATTCTLIDGPSTDLSLMVLEPGSILSVTASPCEGERAYRAAPGTMQAFFCLTGTAVITAQNDAMQLARFNTVVSGDEGGECIIGPGGSGSGTLLRLVWSSGSH